MNANEKRNYRNTKRFRDLRQALNEKYDYTCYICGVRKKKGMHPHHLDENTYGQETLEDLVLVCPACHQHLVERILRRTKQVVDIDLCCTRLKEVISKSKY